MSGATQDGIKTVSYGSKTESLTMDVETGSGSREHTLAVHRCSYSVSVRTRACCGRKTAKTILKDINATFKPGMNAILGPTGSGKSSLLDVLAGRKEPRGLTGNLLIDGAPPPDNFKCMVGYVVQNLHAFENNKGGFNVSTIKYPLSRTPDNFSTSGDDVVMGTLTVKENFQFSAALRLPSSTSEAERERRVDSVIEELGLSKCADSRVGNEFIRGVSGGERKRTNIGMELIISPPVLFLDEPTTGLDASTANSVMYLLKRMSMKGRTIIFSIHQPRFSIFKLFDSMVLLSSGETVYNGPAPEALDYFKSVGYECEEHNNPSDFFLDVINGDYNTTSGIDPPKMSNGTNDGKTIEDNHLAEKFKQSMWNKRVMNEVTPVYEQYTKNVENKTVVRLPRVQYATSFLTQLRILSVRTVRNMLRNPQSSVLQLFISIIFAVIVGIIYLRLSETVSPDIQLRDRGGAFFFIIMNQIFSNLGAVELFIKERAIFMHENVSGFYRVSSYFLAKVFCDVIPMRLIPVTVFCSIAYWMIGFRSDVAAFFFFILNVFMTTLASTGLAFAISASVRIYSVANLLIAMCFVFMMLFGGFLKNLNSMPDWLEWLKYFSIFKYGVSGLNVNEFSGRDFCGYKNSTHLVCISGNAYLEEQGFDYKTTWDLWTPVVALFVISVIFMILAYIQLYRIKKLR